MRTLHFLPLAIVSSIAIACGSKPTPPPAPPSSTAASTTASAPLSPDAIQGIVAAPDRTDADKKLDANRHPAEFLAFVGVGPGMSVGELGAGAGYTTELLARAVGPTGKVYAQNDVDLLNRFLGKVWGERLERPAMKNVVRSDRPFDAPFPPEAKNLDLVVDFIFYHDTVWIGADRDRMNRAVFDSLKPGGAYVIVDASAKVGDGVADAKTLHRIDETVVKAEVQKAGFVLQKSAEFLRNPSDPRDWNSSPHEAGARRGTEDRFVLMFKKP